MAWTWVGATVAPDPSRHTALYAKESRLSRYLGDGRADLPRLVGLTCSAAAECGYPIFFLSLSLVVQSHVIEVVHRNTTQHSTRDRE